jgi:hypothetical protein
VAPGAQNFLLSLMRGTREVKICKLAQFLPPPRKFVSRFQRYASAPSALIRAALIGLQRVPSGPFICSCLPSRGLPAVVLGRKYVRAAALRQEAKRLNMVCVTEGSTHRPSGARAPGGFTPCCRRGCLLQREDCLVSLHGRQGFSAVSEPASI